MSGDPVNLTNDLRVPTCGDLANGYPIDVNKVVVNGVTYYRQKVSAIGQHTDVVTGLLAANIGYEGVQLSYDILDLVAKPGIMPNHFAVYETGDRDDLSTAATGDDVWGGTAATIPRPAAAGELMSVVSDSIQDGVGGTGIRTIDIHYLDLTGADQLYTMTMNGTTAVDIPVVPFRFINAFEGASWGSTGYAVGNIIIYKTGSPTTIYSTIAPNTNASPDGTFMVPLGHKLFITNIEATASGGKAVRIVLNATSSYDGDLVSNFMAKRAWTLQDASISLMLRPQIVVPALGVVKATAFSKVSGGRASFSFSGWIEAE